MPQDAIQSNTNSKTEFENGLCTELLDFISNDADLKPFYDRFMLECENITKVIELAKEEKLDAGLLDQLKTFNDKFPRSKHNALTLGQIDKTFHEILFEMTDDPRLREIFRKIIMEDGDPTKIWRSIISNETHFQELCRYHSDIVKFIEKKDEKNAIISMQKHFVRVLPHYIQQQFNPKQSSRRSERRTEHQSDKR